MAKLGLKGTSKRANKQAVNPKGVKKMIESLHEDKPKQMTIRIPSSLHKRVKAKCALDEVAINEFVISLIEDALLGEDRI